MEQSFKARSDPTAFLRTRVDRVAISAAVVDRSVVG
jgi:hypothetical protein